MPIVSVTRFRARSLLHLPVFAFHASRALSQVRQATGWIDGAVRRDADNAFWTMTVWKDEEAMQTYRDRGAHGAAMPSLSALAVEASVVRWQTAGLTLPDWTEAEGRMRAKGRASRLKHPGPGHATLAYADATQVFEMRV